MLLQESFENHMPSVEAACSAGRVLRMTRDAATCVSSYSWLYLKIRQANLTLYITMTVTIGFISFEYKLFN